MHRLTVMCFALGLLAETSEYYRIRLPNGLKDELNMGEEPRQHLQKCSAQKSRDQCIQFSVQWGVQLVNRSFLGKKPEEIAETARGWRFLTFGFQELRRDLDGAVTEQTQARLASHRDMYLKLTDLRAGSQETPVEARDTALAYYLRVWDLLPAKPATLASFHQKFEAAEEIKFLIHGLTLDAEGSAEVVNRALRFYAQAYEFHQLPLPGAETPGRLPGWRATVREDVWFDMDAYARLPGTAGIVPHRLLAHSDLENRLLLLRRLARDGSISQSELEKGEKQSSSPIRSLKIDELNRWFNVARERGDRQQVIKLGLKIIALQIEGGLTNEPFQELEFIRGEQKQLGDLSGWAETTIALSTHYIKAEQWREALALIEEAKPVLRDLMDATNLESSLGYDRLVREKLKLPPADFPLDRFEADCDYLLKLLPISKESDRRKQRDQLTALLAVPDTAPYTRVVVAIHLLNTLQELREVDAVGRLAAQWLPEIRRWRGIPGEVDVRSLLLHNDIDRGDLGRFYASFSSYETAARVLRGDNWLEPFGSSLARVFFRLQDLRKADELLAAHMRMDDESALQNPMATISRPDSYHEKDFLLQARIQLERGQKEEALATISRLEARTEDKGTGVKMNQDETNNLALELAQVNAALGKQKEALARVKLILKEVSPLEDTQLWADALVEQARLGMALGEPLAAQVQKIEEVVAGLIENPELSGEKAPDLDIFLADYYMRQGNADTAVERLKRALDFSVKVGLLDPQIIIHRKLGEVAITRSNLPGAIEEYRKSVAMLDSVSQRIPSDVGKVGYRGERNKALPLLVQALSETYRRSSTPAARDELLEAIEAGKSRAMTELLFPGKTEAATAIGLKSLQNGIPPDTAVLEFYIPEDTDQVFRVLLSPSDAKVELLSITAHELSNSVSSLRKQITAIESFTEASFKERAAGLAKSLLPAAWSSSFDSIPCRRLYIVPAGPLHQFPFATLVDGRGRYLDDAEKLEVAYLPSAAMLMRPEPLAAEASRSATFIGPAGEKSQHEILAATGTLRDQLRDAIQRWRRSDFEWEQPLTSRAFLERARNLDNVFLYAHARFLPDDPVSSFIRFAGPTNALSQLTAADLLQTKVGNGLWVLAACSTGGGRVRSGDEVLGLPRALLLAGAGMVVITFWDIDAETSFDIMVQFYTNLAKGASVAAALREARSYARKSGLQPYHWAPFVLVGNHGFRD